MTIVEFNKMVRTELEQGNNNVVYLLKRNKDIQGGMCNSKEIALNKCLELYKQNNCDKCSELNIIVYNEGNIEVMSTNDILLKLKFISQIEYTMAANSFCY